MSNVLAQADPLERSGLSSEEAARRLAEGRGNAVAWTTSRSFKRILADNTLQPVNVALFIISGILLALGLLGDAFLTGGLVVANILISVFQESRAKRQLDRIALLNQPESTVLRDGEEEKVPQSEIVEGDVLILEPGDQIPIDGRLLSSRGLGVDESLLTGESEIVLKRNGDNVVSGTFCVAGSGVCEATGVGASTAASRLTEQARAYRSGLTPLQREVGLVIWAMSFVVLLLAVQLVRSFSDDQVSFADTIRASAVIVALVPQGLLVMTTVSYAMAAVRMAGSGVLIQRMNAVESISNVDVLCLDKTGTITTNRLMLEELVSISGSEDELRTSLGAFSASATYANRTLDAIKEKLPGIAFTAKTEVPFDSRSKWSALEVSRDGSQVSFVLGAPEVLMDRCTVQDAAPLVKERTRKGLRVLLYARGASLEPPSDGPGPSLPATLEPLGLVVLSDEVRQDAASVASEFEGAGIDLKIISGDNPETVQALVSQAGMGGGGKAVSGADIESLDESAVDALIGETHIFGRVTPHGKEVIVRALRRSGRYVAMIGDGVNDVPALKSANVAVSVRSGSTMTRSVADLVLLRDEFSKLPSAFKEGQRIRKGMEGIFRIFLTRSISLTLVILLVSLFNDPFPVTPRHTALIASLTVGIPALGLALWARPERTSRQLLISSTRFVLPAAFATAFVSLVAFKFFLSSTENLEEARTALTITATLCGLLLILFLEPPTDAWVAANRRSGDWRPAAMTAGLFALFIVIARTGLTRDFYELELPDFWGWTVLAALVLAWAAGLRAFWRFDFRGLPRRLMAALRRRPA